MKESASLDVILAERFSNAQPRSSMSTELVLEARNGDHLAFERLAAAAVDRLHAIAWRVLRDPAAAEDAVQECLVRAWRDLRALRDPERWDAWLYRLLRNACRDEQRRSLRRPIAVAIDAATVTGAARDDLADVARRDQVERGFRMLSVDHRMVLALHFYLGLRPREIAVLLAIPEGTAASRIHYGGRALRAALQAEPTRRAGPGAAE
jgi:RNA polymerase sigma-70 factor (ECF subfamily)